MKHLQKYIKKKARKRKTIMIAVRTADIGGTGVGFNGEGSVAIA